MSSKNAFRNLTLCKLLTEMCYSWAFLMFCLSKNLSTFSKSTKVRIFNTPWSNWYNTIAKHGKRWNATLLTHFKRRVWKEFSWSVGETWTVKKNCFKCKPQHSLKISVPIVQSIATVSFSYHQSMIWEREGGSRLDYIMKREW